MPEIPLPSIFWGAISKISVMLVNRLKIDVTLEKTENNPSIMVAYDIARVRYQLTLRTNGWPMRQPNVVFAKVKTLGQVIKSAVSPSGLGEINGSMRLKLFKNELPAKSEIFVNIDFEVKIATDYLVKMDFSQNQAVLDKDHTDIEVLCTSNCDFALEQIFVTVRKDPTFRADNLRIFILDKSSHQVISKVDPIAIRKGDDYIKWITRFSPQESLLFKIVAH
jgi:hypothetical protein